METLPPTMHAKPISDAAAAHGLALDDDAIRKIISRCREGDNHATAEEIACFVELKVKQLRRRRDPR